MLLTLFCVGSLSTTIAQEKKSVVVIDPGHGGTTNLPGSNANNATGPFTKTLEKNLTLLYCKMLRDRIKSMAATAKKSVTVILTRDTDTNISASDRTSQVRKTKAPIFLVLHFNADKGAGTARGSLFVDRAHNNVNRSADNALATKLVAACVTGLKKTDKEAKVRDPVVFQNAFPAVCNDVILGNSTSVAPTRAAYIEVEFLNNKSIDTLLNTSPTREKVISDVCEELAKAILAELP